MWTFIRHQRVKWYPPSCRKIYDEVINRYLLTQWCLKFYLRYHCSYLTLFHVYLVFYVYCCKIHNTNTYCGAPKCNSERQIRKIMLPRVSKSIRGELSFKMMQSRLYHTLYRSYHGQLEYTAQHVTARFFKLVIPDNLGTWYLVHC